MKELKKSLRALLPAPVLSLYHLTLAYLGAALYGFPSRELLVIAVTGTKGKSSTTEMLSAMFEEAGRKTAVLNSIRIKLGDRCEKNTMRMSMPGRMFIQRFMRDARKADCEVAILEMTSEGARQHRHRAIELDCLIFTNLAPEHIESHGSYQAYADAKYEIGKQLVRSRKRPRVMIANGQDAQSARYLTLPVDATIAFSLEQAPFSADDRGGYFTFSGEKISVRLPGAFSLRNALAAASAASAFGVPTQAIARALDALRQIPGRAEAIDAGQNFTVVVDYAHTPDSLEALYDAYEGKRKICVLGSTGGGRDAWKRPVMGVIADKRCDHVILTNEDPYDEAPWAIIDELRRDMGREPEIVMDRRSAIRKAIARAQPGDAVLITGKGTDPTIEGPNGTSIPWSDATVAREEIELSLKQRAV